MPSSRTIAIVTGTRAEFGLLEPVMRAVAAAPGLRLRVVVTGTHWTTGTWRDVTAAGWRIDAKVPMQRRGVIDRAADVAALGRGITALGRAFARLKPDVVLVLGDRIEALAAACAASIGGIHLGHIHGGDRAEGVSDESMRHAISKLAHLHFAASAQSRRRLIRMGENPRWIFHVGSPSIDGLRGIEPAPDAPDLIVIQHPIGAPDAQEKRWMLATLAATRNHTRLVLAPNGDPGSRGIRAALREANVAVIEHLPRRRFAALAAGCQAVVGNSSAGLIEVPALGVPCVNIGPRQAARQKPAGVIDCAYGRASVQAALAQALALGRKRRPHPWGGGRAGQRIARVLAQVNLATVPLRKCNTY